MAKMSLRDSAIERREVLRRVRPGPRVRMAARLYASGAVPTKLAAAQAVGLTPQYFANLTSPSVANPEVTAIIGEVDQAIHNKSITLSAVIAVMARRAAGRLNQLIESPNEHVALKASADILDRNPETSKMQRHAVASFSLDSADAKELATALVAGAKVKERYAEVAAGDFVKVKLEVEDATPGKLRRSSEVSLGQAEGDAGDSARSDVAEYDEGSQTNKEA